MTKMLSLIFLMGYACGAQIVSSPGAPGISKTPNKEVVNVITDCGAKGDGKTDDAKAINDCFQNYKGKTIAFPVGVYFAASDIIQVGDGTIARGGGMPSSNEHLTGTVIKFGQGAGWKIGTQDSRKEDCQNCVLEDIGMVGPNTYTGRNSSECIIPARDGRGKVYGNGLAVSKDYTDGTTINSNFVTLRHVWSGGFARYGFRCNGNSTSGADGGWCDNASIENTLAWGNRGSGYFVSGTDSNASEMIQTRSYYAQMWGFELYAFLGMSTLGRSAHTNHVQSTKAGSAYPIKSIHGAGTTATMITAEPIPGVADGNIVVVAGTTNWNGSYAVSAYDGNHTYTLNSLRTVPGAENSGTVRLATCDEAWVATGIDGGGVKNNSGAVTTVEVNPYNEGDNGEGATGGGAAKYNPRQSIVIAGDQGPGFDVVDGFAPAAWLTTDLSGFEIIGGAGFRNFVDNKRYGTNKITLGKGANSNEANNSFLMLQDLLGGTSPKFAMEWRKTDSNESPWFGLRTHSSTDEPGLSNFPILFGYGATTESCDKTETVPNCSRPKTWFPNGFYLGNDKYGVRILYGETTTGRPPDSVGRPGDWMLNAKPTNSRCAAWVKDSGVTARWRCIPLVEEDTSTSFGAQPTASQAHQAAGTKDAVCDETRRGEFHFVEGVSGVKDRLELCAKDATDHYGWHQLY